MEYLQKQQEAQEAAGIARTTRNAKYPSQLTYPIPEDLLSSKPSLIHQGADFPSVAHKPSEAMQNGCDGILVSKTPRASDYHCPACLTASRAGRQCPTCDAAREMLRQKDLLGQHLAKLQITSAVPLTHSSSLSQGLLGSYDPHYSQSVRKASPATMPRTHASRLERLENTSNVVDRERIESWLRTSTGTSWDGDPIYSATHGTGKGNVGSGPKLN